MAQNVRLTINPELEKALGVLRTATAGTLNTTELIKLAIGELAQIKLREQRLATQNLTSEASSHLFYQWAREDGSLDEDMIARPESLQPYRP